MQGENQTTTDLGHLLPVNKLHLESLNGAVRPDLVIMITGVSAMPVTGLIVHRITGQRATKNSQQCSHMLPW